MRNRFVNHVSVVSDRFQQDHIAMIQTFSSVHEGMTAMSASIHPPQVHLAHPLRLQPRANPPHSPWSPLAVYVWHLAGTRVTRFGPMLRALPSAARLSEDRSTSSTTFTRASRRTSTRALLQPAITFLGWCCAALPLRPPPMFPQCFPPSPLKPHRPRSLRKFEAEAAGSGGARAVRTPTHATSMMHVMTPCTSTSATLCKQTSYV